MSPASLAPTSGRATAPAPVASTPPPPPPNDPSSTQLARLGDRRRALAPVERAFCRVLRNQHELDINAIAARTRRDPRVVARAAKNEYSQPDAVADDAALIAGSAAHAQIIDEESGAPAARAPPQAAASSAPAGSSAQLAPVPPRPQSFLARFVQDAALGPEYHHLFVAAQVTEDALRRMARLDDGFTIASEFLRGLVPTSSAADHVMFATAVRGLAQ
ncbi:hypothetical protein FB451DRAFT_1407640 [Mycena latifolia]|nr:hypothetical protein FB451DRAFT_1407640 [Mycena latifolia]